MSRRIRWIVGLALLLCVIAQAARADFPWAAVPFFGLSGGLHDGSDSVSIQPTEAAALQNVIFTIGGSIKKRPGFSHLNASANPSATSITTGGTMFKRSDGTRQLVRLVNDTGGDQIQKMDYGSGTTGPDGTWDDITGATALSVGSDHQGSFTQAFDTLVIEDGVGTTAPLKYTGTGNAAALGGSPPPATMVAYHRNHLWSAGDAAHPSRLVFSNICTTSSACLETYTATDFFELDTNDGQVITGLASGLDCLYVWKSASIFRFCGTSRDTFTQEQMVRGIGTRSNASIAIINNQFVFQDQYGNYESYDGGITAKIMSTKIKTTLTGLSQSRLSDTKAAVFDDGSGDLSYYACASGSGSGTNDTVLVYDTFHEAWTKFLGINCNAIWPFETGTFKTDLAFGDYVGFVNHYPDTLNDAGVAINAFWQSGQLRFQDFPTRKVFRVAQVYIEQSGDYSLTFNHREDFEGGGTDTLLSLAGGGALYDAAVFDVDYYGDTTTDIARVEINKGDYFLQVKFSNAELDQTFAVRGYTIFLEPTGRE